jgi:hypothetical protein
MRGLQSASKRITDMKTIKAQPATGPASGTKTRMKWATLLLVLLGVALGAGGCVGYYQPGYTRGYYTTGVGYGYGAPYGYGYGYPAYGAPYYGAPYGYGGASVVIRSGGYRGRDGRWYSRRDRRREQVQRGATYQRRTGGTRRPRADRQSEQNAPGRFSPAQTAPEQ